MGVYSLQGEPPSSYGLHRARVPYRRFQENIETKRIDLSFRKGSRDPRSFNQPVLGGCSRYENSYRRTGCETNSVILRPISDCRQETRSTTKSYVTSRTSIKIPRRFAWRPKALSRECTNLFTRARPRERYLEMIFDTTFSALLTYRNYALSCTLCREKSSEIRMDTRSCQQRVHAQISKSQVLHLLPRADPAPT